MVELFTSAVTASLMHIRFYDFSVPSHRSSLCICIIVGAPLGFAGSLCGGLQYTAAPSMRFAASSKFASRSLIRCLVHRTASPLRTRDTLLLVASTPPLYESSTPPMRRRRRFSASPSLVLCLNMCTTGSLRSTAFYSARAPSHHLYR